ncbi:hypothetical protein [Bacteriophage Eos]|nr:hypothetical protein [Bacteriophage Eos]
MKITLNVKEVNILMEAIDGWLDHGPHTSDDPESTTLNLIWKKLKEVRDSDRWMPLSQLPPLGIKVMVREVETNRQFLAIRTTYADSYAPSDIEMTVDGKNLFLNTKQYHWTNDYA